MRRELEAIRLTSSKSSTARPSLSNNLTTKLSLAIDNDVLIEMLGVSISQSRLVPLWSSLSRNKHKPSLVKGLSPNVLIYSFDYALKPIEYPIDLSKNDAILLMKSDNSVIMPLRCPFQKFTDHLVK